METVLTYAYASGAALSALLYFPTLLKIIREPEAWRGYSLASWSGWLAIAVINLSYAVAVNGDIAMIGAALAGATALSALVICLFVQRFRSTRTANVTGPETFFNQLLPVPPADNDEGFGSPDQVAA